MLLVPLDDRPCCRRFPEKLGEIAAIPVVTPPAGHLGSFLVPGRPEALLDWLESSLPGEDACVLSIDMLAYGGLVASRSADVSADEALRRMERARELLLAARARGSALQVLAFNVIMRSSPTMTTPEECRMADRLWKLSVLYHDVKAGKASPPQLRKALASFPPPVLERWFVARGRNHRIARRMVGELDAGLFDFLLFGVDDSRTRGINVLERQAVERLLGRSRGAARSAVYPGADEMAMVLLARFILRKFNLSPALHVSYTHRGSEELVPLYEDRSYRALVASYAQALGVRLTDDEAGADVLLFCHTPEKWQAEASVPAVPGGRARSAVREFVKTLGRRVEEGRHVAVADLAKANGADDFFVRELISGVPAPALLSYAAWNTAGNALGTALAHGLIRWVALRTGRAGREGAYAHYRFLLERFLEDWLYMATLRTRVAGELLLKGINSLFFPGRKGEVERLVRDALVPAALEFYRRSFRGFKDPGGLVLGAGLDLAVSLPWSRLFEVELDASPSVEAPPG